MAVIGIGRMANIRLERQARGRAGRQGDPGFSRFFVSAEDEVVKNSGVIKKEKYEKKNWHISKRRLRKLINLAQKNSEEQSVMSRQRALDYDQVLQRQRNLIYEIRDQLLEDGELEVKKILQIAKANIKEFLGREKRRDLLEVRRYILDNISYQLDDALTELPEYDDEAVLRYLTGLVMAALQAQEEKLGDKEEMINFMRVATLRAVDEAWIEQVDYLQQLQYAVAGRSSAQRNPIYEYQKEALESFRKMEKTIRRNMIRNILLSDIYFDKEGELQILLP